MRRKRPVVFFAAAALCLAVAAEAHDANKPAPELPVSDGEPETTFETPADETSLPEVVVQDTKPVSAASSDDISTETYQLRPHTTLQEILNNVPGLIVRQHQGGGKATQYLIRGFNADHGTDFLVTVDQLPVNLVTHGHGQGYADINFVIPETVETLQLRKGTYFPELGDLAVAGALNLVTKEKFAENFVLAEGGSFDRMRYVAGLSPKFGNVQTLFAGQAYYSNGPFENPEHFARYNLFAKATFEPTPTSKAWASATLYAADWDASGQIPQRLVSDGQLDRFGSLDPSEGGRTDRENVDLHYDANPTENDAWSFQAYASRYKMRLWSNFTFFQNSLFPDPNGDIELRDGTFATLDPRGDGIEQNDFRWLYGARGSYTRSYDLFGFPMFSRVGVETRNDRIDVAVYNQQKRNRYFTASKVFVEESSYSGYYTQQITFTDWLRFEGGVRGDAFTFDVQNRLPASQGGRKRGNVNLGTFPVSGYENDAIVSPKANLIVTPEKNTEVYLNYGDGFHSNDARGVIQAKNDKDFAPLAKATGYELGSRTRQFDKLDVSAALWLVDLESEIVFCGDCGTIEQNDFGSFDTTGPTRRWGVDFEIRYQIFDWLTADYDLSYADPRYKNGEAIPIAPTLFMNGGLTADFGYGFSAAARVRYLDDRPATEDRTLPARGYLLFDLFAKYRWRNVELGIDFLNMGDVDWQEAVFADTSCTRGEARRGRCPNAPDIHFTPGDPFGVRGRMTVFF